MSIFKAYDIRGIYGDELSEETAYGIGRAFVAFLKPETVVVGHDIRESSPKLYSELIRGITDQGATAVKIGLATTPMMYFAVGKYGYDAGICVTASHNPKEYNGMKMVTKNAVPLSGETGINQIGEMVTKGEYPEPSGKGSEEEKEVLPDYIENIIGFVDIDIKNFKIVVDAANAMGGLVVPPLFERLPCQLVPMYMEMDGTFPNHEPNPLKTETLDAIRKKVVEEKADLGIALDGDSDRIFFIDEKGEVVSADLLGARIAEMVLEKHPKATILYDLRSSRMVKETVEKKGGTAIKCRVGHSFIKRQMRDEKAEFALELSAHYYLADNFYIESPYVLTMLLLEQMTQTGKKLSELIEPMKRYYASGEINSEVADKDAVLGKLKEEFSDGEISELDGLSVDYPNWWFNVRPSNTEPLLRLNLESDSKEHMEQMRDKVLGIIRG